jgi:PAS domain S-box-containing protein
VTTPWLRRDRTVPRTRAARYGLSLGFLAAATLLRVAVDPLVSDQIPFEVYLAAAVVSAWFAGSEATVLLIAASAFLGDYLFVSPRYELGPSGEDWIRMAGFAALAVGLVALVRRWRRSEEHARAQNADLQEALKALRASERLYRAIGESIDFGVWVCAPDGRNTFASESFLRLVGITQEQCSNFGWGDVLHPDDAERTITAWKECVRTGGAWDIEHRFRGVDGEWHPVLARGAPVRDEAGGIVCWGGINLDISRLKRTEEELRAAKQRLESLLENSPLAVIEWSSADFSVVRWSDEATRVFGWTPKETVGRRITELAWIYPADQHLVDEVTAGMLDGSRPRNVSRHRNVRKDGTVIHCEWYNSTLQDGAGAFSVLSLVLDVTDRERAVEELAAANRAKDEFLSVLSHELRTPLNAILGWSEMLSSQVLDAATTRKALDAVRRNAHAQLALINDVLDVSRIVSGKFRLDVRPVDLADVLRESVDAVRPAAEARRLSIALDAEDGLTAVGDRDRLQQIFWNLLSNSVKFTQPLGRVDVTARRAGTEIEVTVDDTGIGIAPDFLPHVFERFRQADSSTTRSTQGGLGLGLAIVRHLTELHGGSVSADSGGPGRGARFTVRLPWHEPAGAVGELPAVTPGVEAAAESATLQGLDIVVVDDHDEARMLLEAALARYGGRVITCADGASAIDLIRRERPDVVVADIAMPGMDGYEMMRRLRALPGFASAPPALALTAFGTPEDRRRALDAGFQDHVIKPVVPDQLVRLIRALARARV